MQKRDVVLAIVFYCALAGLTFLVFPAHRNGAASGVPVAAAMHLFLVDQFYQDEYDLPLSWLDLCKLHAFAFACVLSVPLLLIGFSKLLAALFSL